MTAHQDLLDAVASLEGRGIEVFSPAQLIAEARSLGSTYPDSTLRTHILGPMTANSPEHHATKWSDLERIGRGIYRRFVTADASDRGAVPGSRTSSGLQAPAPTRLASHAEEWVWEGNVQAAVVAHVVAEGWRVIRVADTAGGEHGVDIEATRNGQRLLIEVKGYPGSIYAKGAKKGEPRTGSGATQGRAYFAHALLAGLMMRDSDWTATVVLAFPEVVTYRNLVSRTRGPLRAAGIDVWLVAENGNVVASSGISK